VFFCLHGEWVEKTSGLQGKFPVKSGAERKAGSVTGFDSQFEPWCEYFTGALPCFSVNFT
jgi:hypothetical protein